MESKDPNKDSDDEKFPAIYEHKDEDDYSDIALTECHDFDMESMESFI